MHKKIIRRAYAIALLASLFMLWVPMLHAEENPNISVIQASLNKQNGTYVLNAEFDISLSGEAIEALDSGVTLIFSTHFNIASQRKWLWNTRHFNRVLSSQLKYHTLAETYQVTSTTRQQQSFSNLWSALTALGTIEDLPFRELELPEGSQLIARLKTQLNIEALPLPMRPLAYITPGWYLQSDDHQWPINP
jgi:hypothetical protein